ncbi:hypothetical protein N2152v2_005562 [Parachlorella kessleri]
MLLAYPGLLMVAAAAASSPQQETERADSVQSKFKALGVDERLLEPLRFQRITEPTDVQRAAIPEILTGANVAVQSYTGSGKTLAYLLPVMSLAIQRAEAEWAGVTRKTAGSAGTVQAVVVAPSRELAMQILRVAQGLLPESAKRAVQQCIGGANMIRQKEALKAYKPFLVVGTPGRIAELSRDGALQARWQLHVLAAEELAWGFPDLTRGEELETHKCGILVLDEADQLLAPQFREEMSRITGKPSMRQTGKEHCGKRVESGRQTILVSATLTPKVLLHCQPWCPDPRKVFVGTAASALVAAADGLAEQQTAAAVNLSREGLSTADSSSASSNSSSSSASIGEGPKPSWGWGRPGATSVSPAVDYPTTTGSAGGYATGDSDVSGSMPPHLTHLVVSSAPQHKVDTLRRAIHALGVERALVFMNFQQRLKDTEAKLTARGMAVGSLHGELDKQERQKVLKAFREGKSVLVEGKLRALVVSDVAARGLDVPECDAVFHLELPTDPAHYAHRAGRTGRAGRPGTVVSLVSGGERFVVDKLGRRLGVAVREVEISHGEAKELGQGQAAE